MKLAAFIILGLLFMAAMGLSLDASNRYDEHEAIRCLLLGLPLGLGWVAIIFGK